MIIVSGIRAGLVIGLIVTSPKIQHDGFAGNRDGDVVTAGWFVHAWHHKPDI